MYHVINNNPNSSNNVNGVEFEHDASGRLVSVRPVGGEALEIFRNVPGFIVLDEPEAEQPQAAAEAPQPEQPAHAPAGEGPADAADAAAGADAAGAGDAAGDDAAAPDGDAAPAAEVAEVADKPATKKAGAKK